MTLRPVERWASQAPGFNRPVADAVFDTVMKMDPDEAVMFTRVVADAILQDDLMVHGEQIAKTANVVLARRAETLQKHLARTVIAKGRRGEDASAELVALETITKSWLGDMFSHTARQARARKRHRDLQSGQFVVENHPIAQNAAMGEGGTAPTPTATEEQRAAWAALTPEQRSAYQQAYRQVSTLVRPYQRAPERSAFVHLRDDTGAEKMAPIPHGENAALAPELFDRGGAKIVHARISLLPPENAQGGIMSLFNAIGLPRTGAVAAGSTEQGALNAASLTEYRSALDATTPKDEHQPSLKVFRRLGASSKLISDTLGNAAPPQAKMALGLAQHVAGVGPHVQAVVGPTLDRAAYRYRGTERTPDPRLRNAMAADAATAGKTAATAAAAARGQRDADTARLRGLGSNKANFDDRISDAAKAVKQANYALASGRIDRREHKARVKDAARLADTATKRYREADKQTLADHKQTSEYFRLMAQSGAAEHAAKTRRIVARGEDLDADRWKPGETLNYFHSLVPSPELNALHLTSGNAPASQGIILDSKGKVTTQSIGYGDDHYLPFPLKTMRAMRGGSYIRTRTWGGPTAEDIRTALIGGARQLTVVSNSGVFHVDFDDTFTGGRRHNDKAHRMIGRYEHLLDAVKSGNVTRGELAPSRLDELREEAGGENAFGFVANFKRLREDAIAHPQLSQAQRAAVAEQFLHEQAERRGGDDYSVAKMTDEVATERARTARAALSVAHQAAANEPWRAEARANGDPMRGEAGLTPVPSLEVVRQDELDKLRGDGKPMTAMTNLADAIGQGKQLSAALDRAEAINRRDMVKLKLNGTGYATALQALKEQFPYYINDTVYKPWPNTVQQLDTGYVRPGSLRPGAAEAGLFSQDGSPGSTKVRADTIRGQNRGAALAPLARQGADTVAPPEAPAAERAESAENAAAATKRVNREMLGALLSITHFGPNAAPTAEDNGTQPFGNLAINLAAGKPGFPPELRPFYAPGVNKDRLRDQLEDPAQAAILVDRMHAAIGWMAERNALPENANLTKAMAAFKRNGPRDASATTTDIDDILDRPHRDFAFADAVGPIYVAGRGVSEADVQGAYTRDGLVANLVRAGALPPDVRDPRFPPMAEALHATLVAHNDSLHEYNRYKTGTPTMGEAQLKAQTFGLAQALQLRRRAEEAAGVQQAAKEAAFAAEQPARDAAKAQREADPAGVEVPWTVEDVENYQANPEFKKRVDAMLTAKGIDPDDFITRVAMKAHIDAMPPGALQKVPGIGGSNE